MRAALIGLGVLLALVCLGCAGLMFFAIHAAIWEADAETSYNWVDTAFFLGFIPTIVSGGAAAAALSVAGVTE